VSATPARPRARGRQRACTHRSAPAAHADWRGRPSALCRSLRSRVVSPARPRRLDQLLVAGPPLLIAAGWQFSREPAHRPILMALGMAYISLLSARLRYLGVAMPWD
jgi:hypothetical protein